MKKMAEIMTSLRENSPAEIAGYKVTKSSDYLESVECDLTTGKKSVINLPKSNVLSYSLEGGNAAIVRPSSTESRRSSSTSQRLARKNQTHRQLQKKSRLI